MKLKDLNSHERDKKIEFEEGPHVYYIDGSSEDIVSVTTFIHSFFPKFDEDLIIDKMMNSSRWEQSKYYGMSKEEIKQKWEDERIYASNKGTDMHRDIELFYNDEEVENSSDEFNHFLEFQKDHEDLKPYRTEWEIYCEELKLAGSIDMCYGDGDEIIIYDWKRSKNITEENRWDSGYYPLSHLPHSNYWHYCLQLNTYKAILEKNYGKKIKEMYLLCLHPINDKYQKIKVVDLQEEVKMLFEERLKQLKNKANS